MATGAVNGVLGVVFVFVFVFVIVICCKCCMQCEIFLFASFNSGQGRVVKGENRSSFAFSRFLRAKGWRLLSRKNRLRGLSIPADDRELL